MATKDDITTPKKKKLATPASFKKGRAKTGGRKAGTPNKISKDARTILGDALKNHLENVGSVLEELRCGEEPAKYIDAISKLLPFYMPKYQSTTLNADTARNTTVEEHMRQLDQQYSSLEVNIKMKSLQFVNNDEDEEDDEQRR